MPRVGNGWGRRRTLSFRQRIDGSGPGSASLGFGARPRSTQFAPPTARTYLEASALLCQLPQERASSTTTSLEGRRWTAGTQSCYGENIPSHPPTRCLFPKGERLLSKVAEGVGGNQFTLYLRTFAKVFVIRPPDSPTQLTVVTQDMRWYVSKFISPP